MARATSNPPLPPSTTPPPPAFCACAPPCSSSSSAQSGWLGSLFSAQPPRGQSSDPGGIKPPCPQSDSLQNYFLQKRIKKKVPLKKNFKKKKKNKQKTTYFIIKKKVFFSPPVLNGKEEKLTICTEMFLLWHRKITKHKVIFHSFYWSFFLLPVLSAVFISLISCPLGGGVGGYSHQRHIGACVFASSLVHENILWY